MAKKIQTETLADILDRDEDKIDAMQAEIKNAKENLEQLKKQAESATGVPQAEERFKAAVKVYHDAIHYDEFEADIATKLQEGHEQDCWPDSDCRACSYEPDSDEIEEYLLDYAVDFEIEVVTDEPVIA
jgi:hypothetical protein